MAAREIRKVSYHGFDQKTRIENRDFQTEQQFPPGSGYVDLDRLQKSGRDLEADYAVCGYVLERGKFVPVEKIEY